MPGDMRIKGHIALRHGVNGFQQDVLIRILEQIPVCPRLHGRFDSRLIPKCGKDNDLNIGAVALNLGYGLNAVPVS
jgi:hypothetical protein